jgi:hypothetical protein
VIETIGPDYSDLDGGWCMPVRPELGGSTCAERLWNYCQRTDPLEDDYCDPGNCGYGFGSNTGRWQYKEEDWYSDDEWPYTNILWADNCNAGVTTAWCTHNAYPLYLNSSATAICFPSGVVPPETWYTKTLTDFRSPLVHWYNGQEWKEAYTAGDVRTNWDWQQPSSHPPFLDSGWVDEFLERFDLQQWPLVSDAEDIDCTCVLKYPASPKPPLRAGADVFLETFGDFYGWGTGGIQDPDSDSYVENRQLFLISDTEGTPESGDRAYRWRNPNTTGWPNASYPVPTDRIIITFRVHFESLGNIFASPTGGGFQFMYNTSSLKGIYMFVGTDGVWLHHQNLGVWTEAGNDANKVCVNEAGEPTFTGCEIEFTIRYSQSGHVDQAAYTADIWIYNPATGIQTKIGDDIPARRNSGSVNPGRVEFSQFGYNVATEARVRFLAVSTDFEQ